MGKLQELIFKYQKTSENSIKALDKVALHLYSEITAFYQLKEKTLLAIVRYPPRQPGLILGPIYLDHQIVPVSQDFYNSHLKIYSCPLIETPKNLDYTVELLLHSDYSARPVTSWEEWLSLSKKESWVVIN